MFGYFHGGRGVDRVRFDGFEDVLRRGRRRGGVWGLASMGVVLAGWDYLGVDGEGEEDGSGDDDG